MKTLLLALLFLAQAAAAQVTYVDRPRADQLKTAAGVIVVLASQDAVAAKKLARAGKEYADAYQRLVDDYNEGLRSAFARHWKHTELYYVAAGDIPAFVKAKGYDEGRVFLCAVGELDRRLADVALQMWKRKTPVPNMDRYLATSDDQGSLDIFAMSQWADYKTSKDDWAEVQAAKMKLDKKLGKTVLPGDYLRHRKLEFVGFFLSQHALPTRSDLEFALYHMQADFSLLGAGNAKSVVLNKPPTVRGADFGKKTLLVGRDLVFFPGGKAAIKEAAIKAAYPHPFKIVAQSEIEKAFADKSADVAVVVPITRWSPTGYPELLVFYVVDAADGHTVLSFADTGSGSNPTTANNFEKSAEMKAKHFKEIIANAER
jgi:hypothetical protein